MKNKIIKSSLIILIILILLIFYLSFFGLHTEKFNKKIKSEILKNNQEINLVLKKVKFLLNPFNFSVNIKTYTPVILLDNNKIKLEYIKTNISLKSFINKEFSVDDIQISSKTINIKDIIRLAQSYKNSPELIILNKVIKKGSLVAEVKLNFNKNGKIKNDYEINGFIKNTELDFFKKHKIENLDLFFEIKKNNYTLKNIKSKFNQIKLTSPLIKIKKKKSLFLIDGKLKTKDKDVDIKLINNFFKIEPINQNIKNINFNSDSDFTFSISKRLKVIDLNLKSQINLNKLDYNFKSKNLKKYLPNFKELIKLKKHKILINLNNGQLDIKGNGDILIGENLDLLEYEITKIKDLYKFNTKIFINQNSLSLDFLSYKKKKNVDSLLSLEGLYKKDKNIEISKISLDQNDNKLLIKNLILSERFKFLKLDLVNINFVNDKKIRNNLNLNRNNKNYDIKGKSFDATKLIDEILNNEDEDEALSTFDTFNSIINVNIDKFYLDNKTYVNNLIGNIVFKNNKIKKLNLNSTYPNNKKLALTIDTNQDNEKITTLYSDYPKPLVKKYEFIKGFEEGVLDFYSINKNDKSTSTLKIDNFKVKEVPVLAKLLSLASLQGIADLLTGEGVRFTDFEMNYSSQNGLINIDEMYAIGPAVSILMEGYVESNKLISLRGTLVPATTINRTISSIPLIGKILVGNKVGEGVFGVSFKIKGPAKNLKTTVNPIKTLTPRFITRTLEKIKKN